MLCILNASIVSGAAMVKEREAGTLLRHMDDRALASQFGLPKLLPDESSPFGRSHRVLLPAYSCR
jgi:hypothetical protein